MDSIHSLDFHSPSQQQALLDTILDDASPNVVLLAGEPGIGRRTLCRAACRKARHQGEAVALWELDLAGFEPEESHGLALFSQQMASRVALLAEDDSSEAEPKAPKQVGNFGVADDWAACLISLAWQFEEVLEWLDETSTNPQLDGIEPDSGGPALLRPCLDLLTRSRRLVLYLADAALLNVALREGLMQLVQHYAGQLVLAVSVPPDPRHDVWPQGSTEILALQLGPWRSEELKPFLQSKFADSEALGELEDILIQASGGWPGALARRTADLVELGAVDLDDGGWSLQASAIASPEARLVASAGLFAPLELALVKEEPEIQTTLRRVLLLIALGHGPVPLAPIFGYLQLDKERRDIVTDFIDDVLESELSWLRDGGFHHPSFPGINVYEFRDRLLRSVSLSQFSEEDREIEAVQFLRFLEEKAQPRKRGMVRWFLSLAEHLRLSERTVLEHKLRWWCGPRDTETLRQDVQRQLKVKAIAPQQVWSIVRSAAGWPTPRRLAVLEMYGEFVFGEDPDEHGGPSRDETAGFYMLQGELLVVMGRFAESHRSVAQVLRLFQEPSIERATALNLSGCCLEAMGRIDEARLALTRSVEILQAALPANDLNLLKAKGNLSSIHFASGDDVAALELQEEVYEGMASVLGPGHPDTLSALGIMARTLCFSQQLERSLELAETVAAGMQQALGMQHPRTLKARGELARICRTAGDNPRALELAEQTLGLLRQVHGAEHPSSLSMQVDLAMIHKALGDDEKASALGRAAVEAMARVLGPEHPETQFVMETFGDGQ